MRTLCVLFLTLLPLLASAQDAIEMLDLKHRLPEQVLPVLRPLLAPGGSLSAAGNKLVVRSSAANIAQLREILAAIDTPQRRLMISVRQGAAEARSVAGGGIDSGRVIIGPNGAQTQVQGGLGARDTQRNDKLLQKVQTVEGGEASIYIGRSLALPMRQVFRNGNGITVADSVQMVDVASGFRVLPELAGERVVLSISPQMRRVGPLGVEGSSLSTSITGRLGEWIQLGATSSDSQGRERGLASLEERSGSASSEIWLKVDLLD